jgi:hypothetical protein
VPAIADGVARVALVGEEGHEVEPDRGAAEATMGEEEGWFTCGGVRGESVEKFERSGGGLDRGACNARRERGASWWIGGWGAPLQYEGAEGHSCGV